MLTFLGCNCCDVGGFVTTRRLRPSLEVVWNGDFSSIGGGVVEGATTIGISRPDASAERVWVSGQDFFTPPGAPSRLREFDNMGALTGREIDPQLGTTGTIGDVDIDAETEFLWLLDDRTNAGFREYDNAQALVASHSHFLAGSASKIDVGQISGDGYMGLIESASGGFHIVQRTAGGPDGAGSFFTFGAFPAFTIRVDAVHTTPGELFIYCVGPRFSSADNIGLFDIVGNLVVWTAQSAVSLEILTAVVIDSNDDVYAVGGSFPAGGVCEKFDSSGVSLGTYSTGPGGFIRDVAVDSDDNVYLAHTRNFDNVTLTKLNSTLSKIAVFDHGDDLRGISIVPNPAIEESLGSAESEEPVSDFIHVTGSRVKI